MEPNPDENINKCVNEYYEEYYDFLTIEQGKIFTEETLSGEKNWANAIEFIMSHLMLRGRSDVLSITYTDYFVKVLKLDKSPTENEIREKKKILEEVIASIEPKEKSSKKPGKSITDEQLAEKFEVENLGFNKYKLNPRDMKMIDGLLGFQIELFVSGRKNMFDHLAELISQENVTQAYIDLINISNVGDKLAAFTLRDIVFISTKCQSLKLKTCDYLMLFPIDTWVKKGGKELIGETGESQSDKVLILKFRLISICKNMTSIKTDPLLPLKLNAGIWFCKYKQNRKQKH
jgi:hypothetical protein